MSIILNPKAKESQEEELKKHKEMVAKYHIEDGGVNVRIKIIHSPLWLSICQHLPIECQIEVMYALSKVYKSKCSLDLDANNLDSAMHWDDTPQGHAYWCHFNEITLENGL